MRPPLPPPPVLPEQLARASHPSARSSRPGAPLAAAAAAVAAAAGSIQLGTITGRGLRRRATHRSISFSQRQWAYRRAAAADPLRSWRGMTAAPASTTSSPRPSGTSPQALLLHLQCYFRRCSMVMAPGRGAATRTTGRSRRRVGAAAQGVSQAWTRPST